jgi:hypothetical protein
MEHGVVCKGSEDLFKDLGISDHSPAIYERSASLLFLSITVPSSVSPVHSHQSLVNWQHETEGCVHHPVCGHAPATMAQHREIQ